MKPKVFISSTFGDLIQYRKKVWEELIQLDIEILGMEKFGARKSAPLQTCLEEVTKCDVFIGIIAFRFGSVFKPTKKSFTQIEYEKALELDKEILIYFMNDTAFVQANFVDTGINAKRLQIFKKELQNHTIDTFSDTDELASKIIIRLKEILPRLKSKLIRPKVLDCTITRFKFHGKLWIAFVGYLSGKPYEIFTGLGELDIFPIPSTIDNGKIIKMFDSKGNIRFDFQYLDKYGYRNTMGGLNHIFDKHASKYCSMITKLLQKNIDVKELVDIIDEMDVFSNYSSEDWKKGVKKALNINKL